MRVCLVTPVYPYPNQDVYPGIERNVSELALALRNRDIEVEILTTFWNGGVDGDSHNGIPIHRVEDTSERYGRIGRLFDAHFLSFSWGLRNQSSVFAQCDVTHSFMPLAGTGWIRGQTPLVTTFQHGETISGLRDLLHLPVHHLIERHAYSKSDQVVVPSTVSKAEVVESFDLNPNHVTVIPHGVNVDTFTPANDDSDSFHVLFVGPLEERKNVPTLVRAVARAAETVDQIELHIAGTGPARDEIERTAEEYGVADRVIFHGYCTDDELVPLYRDADFLGFPSHKEGFGMVMLEAMACGTPVIAPDEPPFDEVIGDAGILTSRDSGTIAAELTSLARDPLRLQNLKEQALNRARERFSWDQAAENHLKLYRQLLS